MQSESVPKGILHVGILVSDVEEAAKKLEKLIGIGPFEIIELEYSDVTLHGKPGKLKLKAGLARAGPVDVHLVQSLSGESVYKEYVQRKGYGLHHLAIRTGSLEDTINEMKAKGFKVIQSGKRPGVKWAFFDTEEFMPEVAFEFIETEKL